MSAEVIWENTQRPKEEIYFEVEEKFADAISCNINAFFLATVIPALYYGEERYFIDGKISPVLYEGFRDALGWITHWYYNDREKPIELELEIASSEIKPSTSRNAASFLSGGIDSYETIVSNRLLYPEDHPRFIKDGIIAFGLEQTNPEKFEYVVSMLEEMADLLNVSLVPVYTNIYLIFREDDSKTKYYFWNYEFQGAVLASIGHILSKRIHTVSIGSTVDIPSMQPYGSHPLLDSNYSSLDLQVLHQGSRYSRLEKTKIITDYLTPPFDLRVCNHAKKYEPGKFNCGACEKCIRTMLDFLVLGKLDRMDAFPSNDVTRDMVIEHVKIKKGYWESYYRELLEPLRKMGRTDLVKAIEYKLKRAGKPDYSTLLKAKLIDVDKKVFNGRMKKKYDKYK